MEHQESASLIEHLRAQIEISSQAKNLIEKLEDRHTFARSALGLAAQYVPYEYAVLQLNGPTGASYAIHARAGWPQTPPPDLFSALHIPEGGMVRLDIMQEGTPLQTLPKLGTPASFPLESASQKMGELLIFSEAGIQEKAREVLSSLAQEVSFLARVVFMLEEARRITRIDPVTGLLNRRAFTEKMEEEFERSQRYGGALALLICDIIQLRVRSERVGFMTGERLLRSVARLVEQGLRKIDFVGRWSEHEIALLLPNTPPAGAFTVAERILGSLQGIWTVEPPPPVISIGLASFESDRALSAFVGRVERALLRSKRQGKSKVEVEPIE